MLNFIFLLLSKGRTIYDYSGKINELNQISDALNKINKSIQLIKINKKNSQNISLKDIGRQSDVYQTFQNNDDKIYQNLQKEYDNKEFYCSYEEIVPIKSEYQLLKKKLTVLKKFEDYETSAPIEESIPNLVFEGFLGRIHHSFRFATDIPTRAYLIVFANIDSNDCRAVSSRLNLLRNRESVYSSSFENSNKTHTLLNIDPNAEFDEMVFSDIKTEGKSEFVCLPKFYVCSKQEI